MLDLASYKHILLQIFNTYEDKETVVSIIETVKRHIPDVKIIGTTAVSYFDGSRIETGQIELHFMLFENTHLHTHALAGGEDGIIMPEQISKQLPQSLQPRIAIVFFQGSIIQSDRFLDQLQTLYKGVTIVGIISDADDSMGLFTESEVVETGAVIAFLENPSLYVSTGASIGWAPIGMPMEVNETKDEWILQIDGRCAEEQYADYLGKESLAELPFIGALFPLLVEYGGETFPVTPLALDGKGALRCSHPVAAGSRVTFSYANLHLLIDDIHTFLREERRGSDAALLYASVAAEPLIRENRAALLSPIHRLAPLSGAVGYGAFYWDGTSVQKIMDHPMAVVLLLREGDDAQAHIYEESLPYMRKREHVAIGALSHLLSRMAQKQEETMQKLTDLEVENRRKEKLLLQQTKQAQMGEMISMIAHQWRQPLSAISTLSQTLYLKASLGALEAEAVQKSSSKITDMAMHLSQTIDDFREFFKPGKEKKQITYCDVVEGVLGIIGTSLATKNIEVMLSLECKARFYSYPNELKQVLLNLIKNAQDALLELKVETPKIEIRTYKEADTYLLEVRDNAGGVPQALQKRIFEPYFSTKKESEGTGLGLYMSKIIIEEHCKGKLEVHNSHEGAVFRIALPEEEKKSTGEE